MSQRLLGMLVAVMFAVATPIAANAGTQCGCGQVASPCGDCYGSSVVDPYSTGGVIQGGSIGGGIVSGGFVDGGSFSGGSGTVGGGIVSGGVVDGGLGLGSAGAISAGSSLGCGQSVRYETRTIYESQMTTQMRTVTRTRMRTETRTRNYTVNVQVPTTQTQNYTVMVPELSLIHI